MIRIHDFARGARGLRLVWQCEEMGLPYEFTPVSYPPSDAYRAMNPLGTVPLLEDDGGIVMHESVAMMLYVAHRYGPTPLLPAKDDPLLAVVLQMTVFGESSLGVNALLAAHFGAPEAEKRNWSVLAAEKAVERAIEHVKTALGSSPFLAGSQLTLADISVYTALGIWRGALGKTLPDELSAYQDRMAARPALQRARKAKQG